MFVLKRIKSYINFVFDFQDSIIKYFFYVVKNFHLNFYKVKKFSTAFMNFQKDLREIMLKLI